MLSYPDFIKDRYKNKDVHIVASGPSLIGFDYSYFNDKNVIAVNHAYKLVKNDFVVFLDSHFAARESPEVLTSGNTLVCSRSAHVPFDQCYAFKAVNRFQLDPNEGVYSPRSSGLAALTIAIQGSAKNIYLWGFDYRFFSFPEIVEAANSNGADKATKDFIKNLKKEKYGHATTGKFKHSQDEAYHEIIFKDIVKLFEIYPRHNIFNMSKYSAIPFFERKIKEDII